MLDGAFDVRQNSGQAGLFALARLLFPEQQIREIQPAFLDKRQPLALLPVGKAGGVQKLLEERKLILVQGF